MFFFLRFKDFLFYFFYNETICRLQDGIKTEIKNLLKLCFIHGLIGFPE